MDTETKLFVVCGEHEATLKFRVEANVGGVTIEVEQCPDCKVSNHEEGYEEEYEEGYEKGREEGYEEGYEEGHEEGYKEGHKEGHEERYEEEEQEVRDMVEVKFNPNKKMKDQ